MTHLTHTRTNTRASHPYPYQTPETEMSEMSEMSEEEEEEVDGERKRTITMSTTTQTNLTSYNPNLI